MFRFFLVVFAASVAAAFGIAYYLGALDPDGGTGQRNPVNQPAKLGELLYPAAELPPLPGTPGNAANLLVIEPCHVVVRDKLDVSSPKDGQLLFIGEEIRGRELVFPEQLPPVKYAKVFPGTAGEQQRMYRPWAEGDIVEEGQMLALVDPAVALGDVWNKGAKVVIAGSEIEVGKALLDESVYRLERLEQLKRKDPFAVTDEELGTARVTIKKYKAELDGKKGAMVLAESEKNVADFVLTQHDLRNTLPGKSIIKKIYRSQGEGIKAQETIFQLHNISRVGIEGAVGVQDLTKLKKGMKCYLEPSVEISPSQTLIQAHQGEVTSVAVCADGERFVSGSEDHSAYVWQRGQAAPMMGIRLLHKSAVRVLACSPKSNLLVAGCADGSIYLWNLDKIGEPIRVIQDQHHGAIRALAFSPDGSFFASGGEDKAIHVWKSSGESVYALESEEGHQGTITALHFTPQGKLVSAARDNTLRVWTLRQKGAVLDGQPIANRGGNVSQLGVSADGRYLLFDQGKTLQLIDIANHSTVAVLDNMAGASPFETLALFSPDGSLMLTGGAGEGRLHLWKTPTAADRAYQVRELVSKDRSAITCAAFGPAGKSFAVTGSKDGYVHLWGLPDVAEVNNHRIFVDANKEPLRLDLVEHGIEGGKTRIAANVQNPQERLVPGQRVTLVVILQK